VKAQIMGFPFDQLSEIAFQGHVELNFFRRMAGIIA